MLLVVVYDYGVSWYAQREILIPREGENKYWELDPSTGLGLNSYCGSSLIYTCHIICNVM